MPERRASVLSAVASAARRSGDAIGDLLIGRLFEHEERHLIALAEAIRSNPGTPEVLRLELHHVLGELNEALFQMEMLDFRLETRVT